MTVLLPLIYGAILFFGKGKREGLERWIYISLSCGAIFLAVISALNISPAPVGASLSGMISIFMR